MATRNDRVRCNVKLTPSEEKLFGYGTVKDDSMVCCVLVRELRAQKRDLEAMMERWVEFVDKADRFALLTTEIRDKLAELEPRIETIVRETKELEEIELENEETRERQIDEELRLSQERRENFRRAVDRYAEAEARDRSEQLARLEKHDALERDRLMDRGALQVALKRMMKAMAVRDTTKSSEKKESIEDTSVLYRNPETNEIPIPTPTAARDVSPGFRDIETSLPGQSGYHGDRPTKKCINLRGSDDNEIFCRTTKVRRPF